MGKRGPSKTPSTIGSKKAATENLQQSSAIKRREKWEKMAAENLQFTASNCEDKMDTAEENSSRTPGNPTIVVPEGEDFIDFMSKLSRHQNQKVRTISIPTEENSDGRSRTRSRSRVSRVAQEVLKNFPSSSQPELVINSARSFDMEKLNEADGNKEGEANGNENVDTNGNADVDTNGNADVDTNESEDADANGSEDAGAAGDSTQKESSGDGAREVVISVNTENPGGDLIQKEVAVPNRATIGTKEYICRDQKCPQSRQESGASFFGKMMSIPQKAAVNWFRPKYSPLNPLDILLSESKSDICVQLRESLDTMDGGYKSLYFWDKKELGLMMSIRDLVQEVGAKTSTKTKVFTLEMLHTELIMKDQFQRINDTIEQAINHAPCILFIERIDNLMNSLEPSAKILVDHNLDYLFLYPVLLVATSKCNINSSSIQRLFLDHKIVHLRKPNKDEQVKLFYQAFMKNDDFARRISEIEQKRLLNPFFTYCLDCLGTEFGEMFRDGMNSILGVCQSRTATFIQHVYGMLSQASEKEEFKVAPCEEYFQRLVIKVNEWMATGMTSAINSFDR